MINKDHVLKIAIIAILSMLLMSQALYEPLPKQKAELISMLEKKFDIRDRNIITALRSANREDFLPEDIKKYAYIDISLLVDNSNIIISYSDLMKAITSLKNNNREKALVIGRNSDFTAVLLSFLYKQVYLIESNTSLKNRDETLLREKYSNIIYAFTNDYTYFNTNGPFDLVFINNSINEFTSNYMDLLNQNGEAIFALSDRYGFNILQKATKTGFSYNIITLGEVMFPSSN
jgi:protein-L-isoaspartate(D-aspartate) O-methyltransferase